MREQGMFDLARLVFIDETCTTTAIVRLWPQSARRATDRLRATWTLENNQMRTAAEHTIPGLLRRIGRLVKAFSPQECINFLRHPGYVQI